jgi:MORN repeat
MEGYMREGTQVIDDISYLDGKKHGSGTYTWKDGRRYVGYWKNGC